MTRCFHVRSLTASLLKSSDLAELFLKKKKNLEQARITNMEKMREIGSRRK